MTPAKVMVFAFPLLSGLGGAAARFLTIKTLAVEELAKKWDRLTLQ